LAYSAYASAANLKARIYVPFDAPIGKRALMRACNTEVVECRTREEEFADGLRIVNPPRIEQVVVIENSNGDVLVVDNDEICFCDEGTLSNGALG